MYSVNVSIDDPTSGSQGKAPGETYLSPEHHAPDAYSRFENWYADVEEYTFKSVCVPVSFDQATALEAFRQELLLRMSLRDQRLKTPEAQPSASNPEALEACFDFMLEDWSKGGGEIGRWYKELVTLRDGVDAAIAQLGGPSRGAFLKMSIRSPKDATKDLKRFYQRVEELVRRCPAPAGSAQAVENDLQAFQQASWEALRVMDGREALRLVLGSDRILKDLTCARLYQQQQQQQRTEGEEAASGDQFALSVVLREWRVDLEPEWEFRLFIVEGSPVALTQYNEYAFDVEMVRRKGDIEAEVLACWQKVMARIHKTSLTYTIDFAVSRDVESIVIIEVNNFTAPLCGSALFDYYNPEDRKLLKEGPFSFRINEKPRENFDRIQVLSDGTRIIKTIHPPLQRFIGALRSSPEATYATYFARPFEATEAQGSREWMMSLHGPSPQAATRKTLNGRCIIS